MSIMAACLVRATDRADVNRVIRKRLDVRKISFAAMDDAVRETAMEYGGITPIGLPSQLAHPGRRSGRRAGHDRHR
jgi:prolyl-tRNA editing enzyme YbaK/EbsC (Cys-tRNA(Pro) deacylase)